MPTSLTLKGLPADIHDRLKASAQANHRSLNSEIIARLQAQLLPNRTTADEHLAAIQATRRRLSALSFDHADIDRLKRVGRA
ncbi:MAG: Arc family DNA-binding protein [Pseudomonadota bacterium]|nr:Arc family DNA-binding protein [Pseudomonadota bacterium]